MTPTEEEKAKKIKFFSLDNSIYSVDLIEYLRLDGGIDGFGCWGEIKLKTETEIINIGDGSYYNCPRHIPHKLADFKQLRKIMKQLLAQPEEEGDE